MIKAKKEKHESSSIMVDSKNNMETSTTKWKCILIVVMANGHVKHFHNGGACKDKWGFMHGDFKKSMITNAL